ncbi:MAG: 2-amino-4-oxopentanoate thiolase subunit OrtB [Maledivibacter sp.]|jgi:cysteine synthase|nr:2-amino-4-oxopentanoate thiolase subunit OrtB [Maledivibacter sp.]
MKDMSYEGVMSRNNEIMKAAVGIDYAKFEQSKIAFDYEGLMKEVPYSFKEIREIQRETKVGDTPLFELKNLTTLVRSVSEKGKGARIFVKDEAANCSGSYKDRRASLSVYHAQKHGYKGAISATSGNYGAAVASQASQRGIKSIVVQEVFDSRKVGQPEILEKGRKCEAFNSEVVQLTTGPELFYVFLRLLEETGYFNSSLYSPYSIAGVETLGYEIAEELMEKEGKFPDAVVVTNAGGGNLTGTARGLIKAGAVDTKIIGASVNLKGLHMASDTDFNKKSFTTGHTGFGIPFATLPDRSDVPRNAARTLRYMDRYVSVNQGEVFYVTQALAVLEGLERGPAGNTSLAAALAIAKEMDEDQIIVVQETEYTGAGKHPTAQLTFAKENGIEVRRGNPNEEIPGKSIVIPNSFDQIEAREINLDKMKRSFVKNAVVKAGVTIDELTKEDIEFLAEDCKISVSMVSDILKEMK